MKLGVLAWKPGEEESVGIAMNARSRGHDAVLFGLDDIYSEPSARGLVPLIGDEPAAAFDAVISRAHVGLGNWRAAAEGLHLLSSVPGLIMLDPAHVHVAAVSKFAMLHRLTQAGLPVPPTRSCRSLADVDAACRRWGTVVVKPSVGFGGRDVTRVSGGLDSAAEKTVSCLLDRYGTIICQPYLAHEGDIRITVVGGSPSVSIRTLTGGRAWRPGDIDGGPRPPIEVIRPKSEHVDLALRAAAAMELSFCGIDIIEHSGDPVVIEANVVPGWYTFPEELQRAVNDDVMKHVESLVGN